MVAVRTRSANLCILTNNMNDNSNSRSSEDKDSSSGDTGLANILLLKFF